MPILSRITSFSARDYAVTRVPHISELPLGRQVKRVIKIRAWCNCYDKPGVIQGNHMTFTTPSYTKIESRVLGHQLAQFCVLQRPQPCEVVRIDRIHIVTMVKSTKLERKRTGAQWWHHLQHETARRRLARANNSPRPLWSYRKRRCPQRRVCLPSKSLDGSSTGIVTSLRVP